MISEKLSIEELKKLEVNAKVFIDAGTGSGKTYFVINTYIPYMMRMNKQVLLLCNRTTLKEQVVEDIKRFVFKNGRFDFDISQYIWVTTYQALEQELITNGYEVWKNKYSKYDALICDEVHYFLSDASFNPNVAHSFEFLTSEFLFKQCFFMSATIERVESHIKKTIMRKNEAYMRCGKGGLETAFITNKKWHDVRDEPDYTNLHIECIADYEHLKEEVERSRQKWLIFVPSITEGKRIYDTLKSLNKKVGFCSAEGNENFADYKGRSSEDIKKMLARQNTFTEDVLISTAVIDTGVSIHDGRLLNIAIFTDNRESFLQMLGRKRIHDSEKGKIKLYLFAGNEKYFNAKRIFAKRVLDDYYVWKNKKQIEILARLLSKDDSKKLMEGYMTIQKYMHVGNPYNELGWVCVSELSIMQWSYLYNEYEENYQGLCSDENFFIRKQLGWLGLEFDALHRTLDDCKRDVLKNIAETLLEKMSNPVSKKEKQELLLEFRQVLHESVDSSIRTNENVSEKRINELFEKYNISVQIRSKRESNAMVYWAEET